eukprot:GHVN01027097.1.p1 GENE.GHVN01027097.1~~GHVN01027097.1.p1  ORF type:complete len:571 (+),score=84.61 GHVN01027097.1:220-1713(+)
MNQIMGEKQPEDYLMRKTKIVCTMGPKCSTVEKLVAMIDAGMNVARLNFSHGDFESHGKTIQLIHEAQSHRPKTAIAILLDTKGPEIRTGFFKDGKKEIHLKAGSKMKIFTDYDYLGDEEGIACSYQKIASTVRKNQKILIADGSLVCTVESCHPEEGYVVVSVMNDAVIGERKNMNLPNCKVDLPVLGEKDINDIQNFGIPQNVDFVAASFVQTAEDVRMIRRIIQSGTHSSRIRIISKIENIEGLINFNDILKESDGIMIARGDLGMELAPEKIFLAQKMMIAKCNVQGKPVITATQMLESMTKNPRPTRAEVTDVANAVLDGTDCVMLSGETANGEFPVAAVQTMAEVCLEAEGCIDYAALYRAIHTAVPRPVGISEAVACAAVESSEDTRASLLLALTETGFTARLIAKYRPRQLVMAISASESTIRHLQIHRGVIGITVESFQGTDTVIRASIREAKQLQLLQGGEHVVAVHGIMEEVAGGSNLMKIVDVPY